MPRRIFESINNELSGKSVFVHSRDAAGKLGAHPEMPITSALRILAYGMSLERADKVCKVGKTTTGESLLAFV